MRCRVGVFTGAVVAFLAVSIVFASSAQAAAIFPFEVNHFEDNDWEVLIKGAGNTGGASIVEVGDILAGMFEIPTLKDATNANPTIDNLLTTTGSAYSGVFVTEIIGKSVVGAGGLSGFSASATDFALGPAGLAGWAAASAATGWSFGTPTSGLTAAMFYDDFSTPTVSPGVADPIATANDGTLLWELGFAAGLDGSGFSLSPFTEYWKASLLTDDITLILTFGASASAAQAFDASLNLTIPESLPAPILMPHSFLFDGNTGFSGLTSDLQLIGHFEPLTGPGTAGNFDAQTDTDMYIYPNSPIPEPASVLVWAGLLGAAGLVGLRRRRRA